MPERKGSMSPDAVDEEEVKVPAPKKEVVDVQPGPELADDVVEEDEPEPDDSETLWVDGPNYGELRQWKQKYGNDNVFVSVIDANSNQYCIWRTLNRHEYRGLVKSLEAAVASGQVSETDATMNNEEEITELCVLYPPYNRHDRRNTNAGLPKMISNDVMEQSGFIQVEVRKL